MNRILLLVMILAGIYVLALASLGKPPKEQSKTEIQQLQAEVTNLERRVLDLEQRVRKLETIKLAIALSPGLLPERSPLPEGWQKRYFNGVPYYIVPLENKEK